MNRNLEEAVRIVKKGGIIIFPTDTTFVIGCRIDDEKAVERLFDIRKRPKDKAVLVLVDSEQMASEYLKAILKEVKEKLTDRYWPGGLTIVLPCVEEKVPVLVRGGGKNLGVRMPDHKTTLEMISRIGVPILGPSANFSGAKTPYKMRDLDPKLVESVDFVLPGRCKIKRPSTVLDCSKKPWKVLRQGAVRLETSDYKLGNSLIKQIQQ